MLARFSAIFFLTLLLFQKAEIACAQHFGSDLPDRTATLTFQLRQLAAEGQKLALRDLGSLLSDPVHSAAARDFLDDILIVPTSKTSSKKAVLASKQAFFDFFYQNKTRLEFDLLLAVWRTEPLDSLVFESKTEPLSSPISSPDLQLKKAKKILADALILRKDTAAAEAVRLIAQIRTKASDQAISAFSKTISAQTPRRAVEAAAAALRMQPSVEAVEMVLNWAKKGWLDGDEAEYSISCQLNHYLGTNVATVLADRWKFWRDSLGSIEAIRQAGFDDFITRSSFFNDEIDFWGHILAKSGDFPWIRFNAIEKLARSENPRSLKYLAAIAFQNREPMRFRAWSSIREEAVRLIEKRTFLNVRLPDSLQKMAFFKPHDSVWALHFAAFWAKNWIEMEFDPRHGIFTDRRKTASAADDADRLFRRLSSSNDSVALAAYSKLIETDPALVVSLAEQYRSFSRGFNALLPSFKYRFLESMAQLTAFCRENGHDSKPSKRLVLFFESLDENPPPIARYKLENEAIRDLNLADATALEIEALRRQHDLDFGFSATRVLYFLYGKSLPKIIGNEAELRLFAKKTILFAQIGTVGGCSNYEKRWFEKVISLPDQATFAAQISSILETENDSDLRLFFEKTLAFLASEKVDLELETDFTNVDWARFFDHPDSLTEADLARLPTLGTSGETLFFKKMKHEKSSLRLEKYLIWLSKNASPNIAVELVSEFSVLEKALPPLNLNVKAVDILDQVFDFKSSGTTAERLVFWQKQAKKWGKHTPNWFSGLLTIQLDAISKSDSVTVEALNRAARSPFFSLEARSKILAAVEKTKPSADLRRLALPEKLTVADLVFFENVVFDSRDLDDIGRLFRVERPEILLDFFIRKSAAFSEDHRALFFNELMRQDWLRAFVSQLEKPTESIETVQKSLENRLESEDLSESEENATLTNLLFLRSVGQPFSSKLAAVERLDLDQNARAKLQRDILATASWADLPALAPLFSTLAPTESGAAGHYFLTSDFGLPPLDWAEPTQNQEFVKIVSALPMGAAHAFFLKKFGCDVFVSDESTELDLQKVRPILTFGGATAFAGGGGARRDWTIFGIIKILENENGTGLAFHEKLNENQTFYTFNSAKRAAAWLRFLEEN